jgi:hypothetical protein
VEILGLGAEQNFQQMLSSSLFNEFRVPSVFLLFIRNRLIYFLNHVQAVQQLSETLGRQQFAPRRGSRRFIEGIDDIQLQQHRFYVLVAGQNLQDTPYVFQNFFF